MKEARSRVVSRAAARRSRIAGVFLFRPTEMLEDAIISRSGPRKVVSRPVLATAIHSEDVHVSGGEPIVGVGIDGLDDSVFVYDALTGSRLVTLGPLHRVRSQLTDCLGNPPGALLRPWSRARLAQPAAHLREIQQREARILEFPGHCGHALRRSAATGLRHW
jgi:hypothetical protein